MAKPFLDAKSAICFLSFSFKGKRHKRSTGSPRLADAQRAQRVIDGQR